MPTIRIEIEYVPEGAAPLLSDKYGAIVGAAGNDAVAPFRWVKATCTTCLKLDRRLYFNPNGAGAVCGTCWRPKP